MRQRKIIFVVCMFLICNGMNSMCKTSDKTPSSTNDTVLTPEKAVTLALEYTGFDQAEHFNKDANISVEYTRLADSEIPYLSKDDKDEGVWKIEFKKLYIILNSEKNVSLIRDFVISIDDKSGKLLRIYSVSEESGSSDTIPQPSPQVAESNMQKAEMSFNGLPDSLPRFKFIDVLKEVWGDPSNTKVIKAYFWNISDKRAVRPNTWLIVYYGMSTSIPISVPEGAQEPPFNQRNRLMTVINGDSGKAIYACTPII